MSNRAPKAKGGRRPHHVTPASLANLRPCKPGETHNPSGLSKSTVEFRNLCKMSSEQAHDVVYSIMMDEKVPARDRLTAASLLIEHAHGRPVNTTAQLNANIDGGAWNGDKSGLSILLQRAQQENAEREARLAKASTARVTIGEPDDEATISDGEPEAKAKHASPEPDPVTTEARRSSLSGDQDYFAERKRRRA